MSFNCSFCSSSVDSRSSLRTHQENEHGKSVYDPAFLYLLFISMGDGYHSGESILNAWREDSDIPVSCDRFVDAMTELLIKKSIVPSNDNNSFRRV